MTPDGQTVVLYCIEAMVHGGTEKQLATLIRGLDRSRFEPLLCTLKPSRMDLEAIGCPVVELGFRTFRSPAALGSIRRLRRFVIDRRVDLVQTFFQDPTLLGWLGSVATPVRARIATFRDLGFWRTGGKVAQLRLAYPHFDGFIANARAVAEQVHTLDGIPLDRIEIIPNGVVIPAPRDIDRPVATQIVGIVANLDRPVKRVDLFLEAAAHIRRRRPAVEFRIFGDGHLRAGLEQQARQLGLGDTVRFMGSVPGVADHIRSFDVGVLCSDSEGLSNAILEYMATGVAVVARDVGGNAEALTDGETGLLVPSSAPDALAAAVLRVLDDDALRTRLERQARRVAQDRFSVQACLRGHETYYTRLLTSLGAPAPRLERVQ